MKPRHKHVVLFFSSIVLLALTFRIALVALEFRLFDATDQEGKGRSLQFEFIQANGSQKMGSVDIVAVNGTDRQWNHTTTTAVSNFTENNSTNRFTLAIRGAPDCSDLQPSDVNYTLVTQCDDDRVPLIKQLCLRWSGPLSAAVFTTRSGTDIAGTLIALGCRKEQLFVNTLAPSASLSEASYPVNHLRNLAVEGVKTTHMVYMDVDFLPNSDIESIILSDAVRNVLATDPKHALVIPAYEYLPKCKDACGSPDELLARMPQVKKDLMMLQDAGEASMFHDYWPPAHDTTKYVVWKRQGHGSLVSIPCIKSNHYEPYLIVRKCKGMPPFQEEFTGYGFNKASFTMHLQAAQYRFSQVGGIFCTHFPHAVSKAKQAFNRNRHGKKGKRLQMEQLVSEYAQWLNETYGHSPPVVPYCKATSTRRRGK